MNVPGVLPTEASMASPSQTLETRASDQKPTIVDVKANLPAEQKPAILESVAGRTTSAPSKESFTKASSSMPPKGPKPPPTPPPVHLLRKGQAQPPQQHVQNQQQHAQQQQCSTPPAPQSAPPTIVSPQVVAARLQQILAQKQGTAAAATQQAAQLQAASINLQAAARQQAAAQQQQQAAAQQAFAQQAAAQQAFAQQAAAQQAFAQQAAAQQAFAQQAAAQQAAAQQMAAQQLAAQHAQMAHQMTAQQAAAQLAAVQQIAALQMAASMATTMQQPTAGGAPKTIAASGPVANKQATEKVAATTKSQAKLSGSETAACPAASVAKQSVDEGTPKTFTKSGGSSDGTKQVTKPGGSSDGTKQAIAFYAEQELKKYVSENRLSKETEAALRTLPPEDMLSITEPSSNPDGGGDAAPQNADGVEDILIMARIARLKAEIAEKTQNDVSNVPSVISIESASEAGVSSRPVEAACSKSESKKLKVPAASEPQKPQGGAEELGRRAFTDKQLPYDMAAKFCKKIAARGHEAKFAQSVVEFVRSKGLPTLAELGLLALSAKNAEALMKAKDADFEGFTLHGKMKHFISLVKSKDDGEELRNMIARAWNVIQPKSAEQDTTSGRRRSRSRRSHRRLRSRSRHSRKRRLRRSRDKQSRKRHRKSEGTRKRGRSSSSSTSKSVKRVSSSSVDSSSLIEIKRPPKKNSEKDASQPSLPSDGNKKAREVPQTANADASAAVLPSDADRNATETSLKEHLDSAPSDIPPLPAVSELIEEDASCDAKPQTPAEQRAWEWLKNLDLGKGALLRYFPALRDQFECDFSQLSAAKLERPISSGKLGYVEPSVFEALEMEELEHKLLLAEGIGALPDL
eukprot:TRINITY_DN2849_c0_g3_i3.p1 TRINITY_DN2849_c0_g3~~TRINITY_DN2849_c0_g3_i3.p1  ORF type:complete len:860 (-),score=219.44 TRINITY_DN2849_c0_g3_i3:200-2779(-)